MDLTGNLRTPDCEHNHLSYPWADVNSILDSVEQWLRAQRNIDFNDNATIDILIEKIKAERYPR